MTFYSNNKEKIRITNKLYRDKHKAETLTRNLQTRHCDICDCDYKIYSCYSHLKTKKHIKNLNSGGKNLKFEYTYSNGDELERLENMHESVIEITNKKTIVSFD
jgi:hypothetical protein